MNGVLRLALAQARQDRWILGVWLVGISVLGFAVASAVTTTFANESDRAAIVAVAASNPAFLFVRGLPDGTGTGPVVFFQGYAFTAVLAALMSTFLVVRHTRWDEELGRSEIVGASPFARSAPLIATLVLGAAANLLLALLVAAGYTAAGLPAGGSLLAGLAVGAAGLFFVSVAAAVAQLMPTGRAANGAAAGVVGLAYLVRGVGDAMGTPAANLLQVTSAWPSILSPIGWGQKSRPFTAADPAPVLILVAAAALLAAAVVVYRQRRDLGASVLAQGTGKDRARRQRQSVFGLAWRLQRATLMGWMVSTGVMGAITGGFAPLVAETVAGNASLSDLIGRLIPGSHPDVVDVFATALLGMAGVLAAAAGVQAVLRLRAEESEGRAEALLSTPSSRFRWLGGTLAVAVISVLAVSATAGVAAALTLGPSGAGSQPPGLIVLAALAHAPAAVLFVATTALVFAVLPGLTALLGWGLLAVGLIIGQFGELIQLAPWVQDLSPFRHSSAMPVEEFNADGAWAMTAIAIALSALAALLLRRRDLTA